MKQKLVVIGIAFLFTTMVVEPVCGQARASGRQQTSAETLWQWTGEQVRQIQGAFASWQRQVDRYWSGSKSSDRAAPLPNDNGAVVDRSNVASSTAYGCSGSNRQSDMTGTLRGSESMIPYGGSGIRGGRGVGSGRGAGTSQGRGTGRGRSGQAQGTVVEEQPGSSVPGIGERVWGQGRGPCGQGTRNASGRGRGRRRN